MLFFSEYQGMLVINLVVLPVPPLLVKHQQWRMAERSQNLDVRELWRPLWGACCDGGLRWLQSFYPRWGNDMKRGCAG
jgi:hypothetical protein